MLQTGLLRLFILTNTPFWRVKTDVYIWSIIYSARCNVIHHLLYLVTLSYLKLTKYHHHNVEEMCDVKDLSRPNSLPRCLRHPLLRPSPRPKAAALSSWSGAPGRSPPSRPTSAPRRQQLRTSPAGNEVNSFTCMSVLSCMHLKNPGKNKQWGSLFASQVYLWKIEVSIRG